MGSDDHLLDVVGVSVVATDTLGRVTRWNRAAERQFGCRAADAIGRPVLDLSATAADRAVIAELRDTVEADGYAERTVDLRRPDGTVFPAFIRVARVPGEGNGAVAIVLDATDSVRTERELRSARDYMRTIADGMGQGLFSLDVEGRLIYINRVAEELLGWTQEELTGRVFHHVAHYRRRDGSPHPIEECPLVQGRRSQGRVIRDEEDILVCKDGRDLPVSLTSAPFETVEGVRGTVVLFDDITERKLREQELEREMAQVTWVGRIRAALAEQRFVLYAQPIISVQTREVVQHELLLRMLAPDGSVVAPGVFLPVAEQHGLIVEIDRWVARQAIGLAARGNPVELNLSAHSLSHPGLIADFRAEIERTGTDPSLLVVELTETALVSDERAARDFIRHAEALGCRLALDDFGTGYGGFSYLKRLPVDFLKIDMEFVRDLAINRASGHVVRAVVELAQNFGQQTVAEGVEDEATLDLLRQYGIDHAQGYAIARPAPVEEVLGARPALGTQRRRRRAGAANPRRDPMRLSAG